jgi:hypothetical protein
VSATVKRWRRRVEPSNVVNLMAWLVLEGVTDGHHRLCRLEGALVLLRAGSFRPRGWFVTVRDDRGDGYVGAFVAVLAAKSISANDQKPEAKM